MRKAAKMGWGISLTLSLVALAGFATAPRGVVNKNVSGDAIARHIEMLKTGKAQQRAAAAYWLGQQHSAAAIAVEHLVGLLGDSSEINPAQYRARKVLQKLTLGEEVAAALVNIGSPSIDPLIRVLKTSPDAEARKNAAWALGALHDAGATTTQI
jgi:HEAT repeat protein